MCDPVSLAVAGAGLALSTGSSIMQYNAQQEAHDKNQAAAQAAAAQAGGLLSMRQQQVSNGSAQTLFQMDEQARRADAQTRLQAGASGVAGTSVDLLLADIQRQQSQAALGEKRNEQNQQTQLDAEKQQVYAQEQDRINSVANPSLAALGLKIGGDALNAGSTGLKIRNQGADSLPTSNSTGSLSQRAGDAAFDSPDSAFGGAGDFSLSKDRYA